MTHIGSQRHSKKKKNKGSDTLTESSPSLSSVMHYNRRASDAFELNHAVCQRYAKPADLFLKRLPKSVNATVLSSI